MDTKIEETNNVEEGFIVEFWLKKATLIYKTKEDWVHTNELDTHKIVEKFINDDVFLSENIGDICYHRFLVKGVRVYIFIKCNENQFNNKVNNDGFTKTVNTDFPYKWLKNRKGKYNCKEINVEFDLRRYGKTTTDWVNPTVH